MSRKLNNWIAAYEDYTKNSESPASYHKWGAMACIAGALERKVFMHWGHTTLYPNQYIVIVGPSGQARKGEAITIARLMLEGIGLNLIGEDNSPEAIIRQMRDGSASYSITGEPGGELKFQCPISCFVEEFAVFIGEHNKDFLAKLTNWYDSRDKWKRTTKHQGTDDLMGVCVNILGATAPDWLPMILPREAIGGGFTSRTIFVVENSKRQIISNPNLVKEDIELRENLLHDLEAIHIMAGEMTFDQEGLDTYVDWYEKEEQLIMDGRPAIVDPLFGGYVSRRATHVKKLAMILSASRGGDKIVRKIDFTEALDMMLDVEKRMPEVFDGIGSAPLSKEQAMVFSIIKQQKTVTRADILNKMQRSLDAGTLEIVMTTLCARKVVSAKLDAKNNEWVYKHLEDK